MLVRNDVIPPLVSVFSVAFISVTISDAVNVPLLKLMVCVLAPLSVFTAMLNDSGAAANEQQQVQQAELDNADADVPHTTPEGAGVPLSVTSSSDPPPVTAVAVSTISYSSITLQVSVANSTAVTCTGFLFWRNTRCVFLSILSQIE